MEGLERYWTRRWQGIFRLEIGGSNKCDQDFLFVVCRDGPLTFNHD